MNQRGIGIILLAAGEGTRMKLGIPKPMAPIMGKKLLDYPMRATNQFLIKRGGHSIINIVVGHQSDVVETHLNNNWSKLPLELSIQKERLGTGHAVQCAFDQSKSLQGTEYTFILCADTPLITQVELDLLFNHVEKNKLNGVAASFEASRPSGYGRIVKGKDGFLIREEKDASAEEKTITEVNSGLYIVKTTYLIEMLNNLDNKNASGEFYLTDIFKPGNNVDTLKFQDESLFMGVNNLIQLEEAERILRERKIRELQNIGVYFKDATSNYIDQDVEIGEGTKIYPNVSIYGQTSIGNRVRIDNGAIIDNSIIEDEVHIKAYSCFEDSRIRQEAVIGPFARIRPQSDIGSRSKIGNFVETKKVKLSDGVKVSHLSYVGDAEIGSNTNIGCGFITCNYDGANKHLTKIGKDCFIGSDSQMVAPIELGDNCYVGSGSTINQNMPSGSFAVARAKQVTKLGMAKRFIKSKEDKK